MEKVQIPMEELMPILQLQMEKGGSAVLPVTGTSMLPMLRNGIDSVVITPVSRPLRKGDIPLYKRDNGSYVLHRIVGLQDDTFLCCGDNQWLKEKVAKEQVVAVVGAYFREGTRRSLSSLSYRLYVPVWNLLRPLRRFWADTRSFLHPIKKKTTGR